MSQNPQPPFDPSRAPDNRAQSYGQQASGQQPHATGSSAHQGTGYASAPPPPKKRRVWLWVLIAVLAVILILIAACTAIVGKSVSDAVEEAAPVGGSTSAPVNPSASNDPSAAPDTSKQDSGEVGFDQVYTYDDGVAIEVTKTKVRKISELAAGGRPGEPMVVFTIKVTNKSDQNLDGDLLSVDATYGKDGENADTVFDSSNIGDTISGTINKGRSKTGAYAFAVPKKGQSDVRLEVAPGFDYESVTFSGSVN